MMTGRQLITFGKQLIDAIQKYHLEDFNIIYTDTTRGSGTILEFKISDVELPYPEYKDAHFDGPAHIYKHKVLKIDEDGNSECYDREYDTSQQIIN